MDNSIYESSCLQVEFDLSTRVKVALTVVEHLAVNFSINDNQTINLHLNIMENINLIFKVFTFYVLFWRCFFTFFFYKVKKDIKKDIKKDVKKQRQKRCKKEAFLKRDDLKLTLPNRKQIDIYLYIPYFTCLYDNKRKNTGVFLRRVFVIAKWLDKNTRLHFFRELI